MLIIVAGESYPDLKITESGKPGSFKELRFDDMFHKLLARGFDVPIGLGDENSGKLGFIITFETDALDYKKVRDELQKDPIIQHVAMYETEMEEVKRYLPQELVSELTRWLIK